MKIKFSILLASCLMLVSLPHQAQTIRVTNMIPVTMSNETGQDSEPNLTVNPLNPNIIVGTAFTTNPTGATATAPIFITQDGGATWVLNNIVPSNNGNTGDITVGLSPNNVLYAGILTGGYTGADAPQMQILRDNTYLAAGAMTNLLSRGNEDQPYLFAITPLRGALMGNDVLYTGHNDFNAAAGRTASIEQSLNIATAAPPAGLTTIRLETRTTNGQDGPPIRPVAHPNGTVYAIFYRRTASAGATRTGDVIVVRDDNWGQGATPFTSLLDPGDGLAGRRVAAGISWTWNAGSAMGQERLGDRASIAVDPTDSRIVYIAYIDTPGGGNSATIHVRRSTDSGANWSADLLTINNAIVPQLAVSIRGAVGLLYQQHTGVAPNQRWETHFRQSDNGGTTWGDFTLSNTPSNTPARVFGPYLGDYAGLVAVGKDFYGIFSANNTPNNANFPNGVNFQRNVNAATSTLRNQTNTGDVAASIDPFFFRVQQIAADQDFYVRDWTNSSTDCDGGLEPSTNPVFYSTSDVWNRRSDTPGTFSASDQPENLNPQPTTLGANYAFARVHRKATGATNTVTLHFLKSEFGTGSNYEHANTLPDPTLTFAAGDIVKTMTNGYQWNLNAATSTHVCLAVEISTATDPIVNPSLFGRAPGWPTTDLAVIYDNNKGQRNLGVYTGEGGEREASTFFAIVHNAATFTRDITLEMFPSKSLIALQKRPRIGFVSSEKEVNIAEGNMLVLRGMQPGENRWIAVEIDPLPIGFKESVSVEFVEYKDKLPIDGFTIQFVRGAQRQVLIENLSLHSANFARLAHLFRIKEAEEESKLAIKLLELKPDTAAYASFMKARQKKMNNIISSLLTAQRGSDPFGLQAAHRKLGELIAGAAGLDFVLPAHRKFNHVLDAYLTFLSKENGDVADILQTVRWQKALYEQRPALRRVEGSKDLLDASKEFEERFVSGRAEYKEYSVFIEKIADVLKNTATSSAFANLDLDAMLSRIRAAQADPQRLQKAHRDFLTAVSAAL